MKETGLMFKAPLVRAILEGRKTQTRRLVKPAPAADQPLQYITTETGLVYARSIEQINSQNIRRIRWESPVGKPGDRIYVRETWQIAGGNTGIWYAATDSQADDGNSPVSRWSPSIHMPKSAARIWLEITGVRVERLQSISERDAIAEGIDRTEDFFGCPCWRDYSEPEGPDAAVCPDDPIGSFQTLWDSTTGRPALPANTNSKRYARVKHWLDTHPDTTGWAADPWVWVIDFKTISTTGRPA